MKHLLAVLLISLLTPLGFAQSIDDQFDGISELSGDEACLVQARDKRNNHIQTYTSNLDGIPGIVDAGAKCLKSMKRTGEPLCYCRIHIAICAPLKAPAAWVDLMKMALEKGFSIWYEEYAQKNCHKK